MAFRPFQYRALRTLRGLLDLSPKDQTLRLLDPEFVAACNGELSTSNAADVFDAVRVFSRVKYCPIEVRDPLCTKIRESLPSIRDAELSELCLRVGMFPEAASDVFHEIRRRRISGINLAGAFCGLAQVRGDNRLSVDELGELLAGLNDDDALKGLPPAVMSTVGLTAATCNVAEPHFFHRLYGAMDVARLEGRHCANMWLALATIDNWPLTFITRLEARSLELFAAKDLLVDDCVTMVWALASLEYTGEKLLRPLLEHIVKLDTKALSVAQENQLHQVGLSLKYRPPSWDFPGGLLSVMPVGEEVPLVEETEMVAAWFRDRNRHPEENTRVENFYHADVLVDHIFIVTRPEHERDPWVRLKRRHLEALGYTYYCIPNWEDLSEDERGEL